MLFGFFMSFIHGQLVFKRSIECERKFTGRFSLPGTPDLIKNLEYTWKKTKLIFKKDSKFIIWVPRCLAQRQRKSLQIIFTTKKYDFKIYYALTLQVR